MCCKLYETIAVAYNHEKRDRTIPSSYSRRTWRLCCSRFTSSGMTLESFFQVILNCWILQPKISNYLTKRHSFLRQLPLQRNVKLCRLQEEDELAFSCNSNPLRTFDLNELYAIAEEMILRRTVYLSTEVKLLLH